VNVIREILATILFSVGACLLAALFVVGISWVDVAVAALCFVLAYWVWPSKRHGNRRGDSPLLDILEFVIELPVESFLWLIRLFTRGLFGKSDGPDFDI
jgi:hypothetical protein